MKKILINLVTIAFCLSLFSPAWGIEREKKGQSGKDKEKPSATQTEKKPDSPVEIAPPKKEIKPEPKVTEPAPIYKEMEPLPEEKQIKQVEPQEEIKPLEREKSVEKIKLPPLERKLIDQIDRFVDKNGNGIDDRLEGKEKQAEKPKPVEKKKKRD